MADFDCGLDRDIAERAFASMRSAAEIDHLLDEALGDTFPASDPVSELRISSPASGVMSVSISDELRTIQDHPKDRRLPGL